MRRLPLFRPLLALTAGLMLAAVAILVFWRFDRVAPAPGLLAGGSHRVTSPRDGLIATVRVAPGQQVAAGEEVIRLDTRDLEAAAASLLAETEALQADRDAALAERRHLEEKEHPEEIAEARASLRSARLKDERAEESARAIRTLGKEGLASGLEVSETELARDLAAIALEEAERAIPVLEARQRARIEALAARVRQIEGEIASKRVQRELALQAIHDSAICAPAGGAVTTGNLDELPGRAVEAGEELLRLATGRPERFDALLTDAGRAVVRPGHPVKIRLDGYPWLIHGTLRGRVVRVSERRAEGGGFPVEIAVDEESAPGPLREGMRGVARIVIDEKVSIGRLFIEKITGRAQP